MLLEDTNDKIVDASLRKQDLNVYVIRKKRQNIDDQFYEKYFKNPSNVHNDQKFNLVLLNHYSL